MTDGDIPEARRLANLLEQSAGASSVYRDKAAAELRRLHKFEVAYGVMMAQAESRIAEQEPVLETVYETIIHWDEGGGKRSRRELARRIVALYTAPTPRQWVGLTDEEKAELDAKYGDDTLTHLDAVEAKLKEKNT